MLRSLSDLVRSEVHANLMAFLVLLDVRPRWHTQTLDWQMVIVASRPTLVPTYTTNGASKWGCSRTNYERGMGDLLSTSVD